MKARQSLTQERPLMAQTNLLEIQSLTAEGSPCHCALQESSEPSRSPIPSCLVLASPATRAFAKKSCSWRRCRFREYPTDSKRLNPTHLRF